MGGPKVQQKTKEQKMKAAMAGGKGRKKKWSKGMKEKLMNLILWDKSTYDKLLKEMPKAKLISPSVISERLKVNGSLARQAIKILLEKDLIAPVGEQHHSQQIYTRKVA